MSKVNIYKNRHPKYTGNAKKVSVIIPNYNYEKYIEERIDSIVNQTYPIYELIVLDDCSTDNSVEVIKNKLDSIKGIKTQLVANKTNSGGVFKQWQKGIELASGDYFWIAEADDSAEDLFLETLMKGFDDKDVVISYCESARIDGENNLIRPDSQDLYNIFGTSKWDVDYINKGEDEIKEALGILNTILNVSSVVWKKQDIKKILEKASEFKVAGDWYIYYSILKTGSVAFFHDALNYYRKHGSSVSTDVKDDIEYKEICFIQNMANTDYNTGIETLKWQRIRRNYMDANVSKDVKAKKIAWVMPHPGPGSGGHRTIIQNVNALIRHGYECDIYVENDWVSTDKAVEEKIDQYYEKCGAKSYVGFRQRTDYDLVFATGWSTIAFVRKFNCEKKAYFIQDFEPWFFPMGDNYLNIEDSYRYGWSSITIGKWLSHKMMDEYDAKSQYFDFCADLNVYHPLKNVKKENAICYIWQPEKPRRCDQIALKALEMVKELRPDIKIYLYGSKSNFTKKVNFEAEKLGIIPIDKCNELYNKCKIGLCMSASNPSRIPFEMMAAGLPVVELYKENNLYDIPSGAVSLAEPNPEAIASAIIQLIDDDKKLSEMSKIGINYMKDYPLEKGFEQFVKAVDNLIYDKKYDDKKIDKMYKEKPVRPSKELRELGDAKVIYNDSVDFRSEKRKKLTVMKHTAGRIIEKIGEKIEDFSMRFK